MQHRQCSIGNRELIGAQFGSVDTKIVKQCIDLLRIYQKICNLLLKPPVYSLDKTASYTAVANALVINGGTIRHILSAC